MKGKMSSTITAFVNMMSFHPQPPPPISMLTDGGPDHLIITEPFANMNIEIWGGDCAIENPEEYEQVFLK